MEYFKQNKLAVALIAVLLVLNIMSVSFILLSPIGSGFMMGREHIQAFIEQELKLTDTQKQQFAELRGQFFLRGDSMVVLQSAALESMFVQLKSTAADTTVVRRNAEILGTIETQRSIGLFNHFRAIRTLCTPEQQKKFDSIFLDVLRKIRDPHGPPKPGMH